MQVVKPFIHINGEFHTGSVSASRFCLKITVSPVVVMTFSENMSWEDVGMDNSVSVSVVVSIKETPASPLHPVIPVLVLSANSTEQVYGWKSSSSFLNLAITMTICKVSHDFTISPFLMILHPGRVLLSSPLLTLNTYSSLFSSAIRFTLSHSCFHQIESWCMVLLQWLHHCLRWQALALLPFCQQHNHTILTLVAPQSPAVV